MRLTNKIREQVIEAIVQETIGPRVKKWKKKANSFGRKFLLSRMTDEQKEWLAAAPKGAGVPTMSHIGLQVKVPPHMPELGMEPYGFGGDLVPLEFPGVQVLWDMRHRIRYERVQDSRWGYLQEELATIQHDYDILKKTLRDSLWACSTDKQLREHYPTLAKYLPKPEPVKQLPAVTEDRVLEVLECAKAGGCG